MKAIRNIVIIVLIIALCAALYLIYTSSQKGSVGDGLADEGNVIINEFMASNSSCLPDENGEYSDWIELYNPTNQTISLAGMGLSDDSSSTPKWAFPSVRIEPGKYLVVFASGKGTSSTDAVYQHAAFKLSAAGGSIYLTDASGSILDEVKYETQTQDVSMGREPSSGEWQAFSTADGVGPTPGFSNDAAGRAEFEQSRIAENTELILTEVMSSNKTTLKDNTGNYSDYIEIYNQGSEAVNLAGYGLSDDSAKTMKWKFPEITIEPGQYLVVFASGSGDAGTDLSVNAVHTNFRISSYQETIVLSNPQGLILDQVFVSEVPSDNSYSRILTDGAYGSDWEIRSLPTPGYSNDDAGYSQFEQNNQVAMGDIIISEVMTSNAAYVKEDDDEYYDWIELYNRGSKAVDLSGYGLTDDTGNPAKWRFSDVTIDPGQYLVVMASGLDVKKKYIHTNYKLSAGGEILALFDSSGSLLDRCNLRRIPVGASEGRSGNSSSLVYFKAPTPGAANDTASAGAVDMPLANIMGGSYDNAQSVSLSCDTEGAEIYYTTDGTEPTQSSARYAGTISVASTGMIQARAYKNGYIESGITTESYIIGEQHTLPIVSLVTDPDLLFGAEHGIYTNYSEEWEVPASMALIEDGRQVFVQNIGLRLFGAYSRSDDQKSFAIFARGRYGDSSLSFRFFDTQPFTEYKSIVLRAGGNDGKLTKLRDVLAADLAAGELNVEYMDYRACLVYLNGEYWGVYYMREKVNKYYLAQHYDIEDLTSIDLLVGNGSVLAGDNSDYKALIEFCKNHSLADQENFNYVASQIDVDNYMDWCIAEIFFSNADLGNVKFWRSSEADNKWRWILYDIDWGFYKVARNATKLFFNEEGRGASFMYSTQLSRSMLQNDAWREAFLEKFAELLNTRFSASYMTERLNAFAEEISSERSADRAITGQSEGNFNTHMARLQYFVENRAEVVVYELRQYFGLSEQETIDRFGTAGRAPTQWEIDIYGQ